MSAPTYPSIAIVDIPGKGKGVVAREPIRRGTRIIAEEPRIRVPHYQDRRQALDLKSLSDADLKFFLTFPCEDGMDPVRGRLRHLIPCVGAPDEASALFETVCRMNHTCYSPLGRPNALYTWVEERKEENIAENEEITVGYIQAKTHVMDPFTLLRQQWGFDCRCAGCQRPLAERLESVERVQAFNVHTREVPDRMERNSGYWPLDILDDIERNLLAICAEGYVWEISGCAHDAFQLCAFYGDGASAARWEVLAREVHRVIHGVDHEFEKSAKLVARPTGFRQWKALVLGKAQKLRGPSQKVLSCFKQAVMTSNPIKCSNHECSKTEEGSVKFRRCKSCLDTLGLDVYYCSGECQIADWKSGHKSICGKAVKV
ncbi:hypothetical protein GGX14DRAFT_470691 [Mycena pura]|uniref:MYND-type domain-containing protein n=1 Tax=Mycena pura TaxID=153505 RepID=A0AAD6V2E5_9AGAR|nr:hypothetical protein GGX14DRAFT_470691 [Mycena pura]